MKKSLFVFFASVGLICALSFEASAQNRPRGINKRQHNQQKRIYQGVKSGELTPRNMLKRLWGCKLLGAAKQLLSKFPEIQSVSVLQQSLNKISDVI